MDETFIGDKEENKHAKKNLHDRAVDGKTAVVGIKDRDTNAVTAKMVAGTDRAILQGFVKENIEKGAEIYTDDHGSYHGLPKHTALNHSIGEYVDGMAHTDPLPGT